MENADLVELEKLQNKFVDDIIRETGIEKNVYLEYRDHGKEIEIENAEKLSHYFKVPVSFFLRRPNLVHHGRDNSFGPIYHNNNFFFAKPETEEDVKRLLK